MKKAFLIIGLLLLLSLVIGVERMASARQTRATAPDERSDFVRDSHPKPADSRLPTSASNTDAPASGHRKAEPTHGVASGSAASESDGRGAAARAGRKAEAAQIWYVRSKTILNSDETDEETLDRLKAAIQQVVERDGVSEGVIDLDGMLTSGSPFLLFAHPRFDLTDQVSGVFRKSEGTSQRENLAGGDGEESR